MISAWHLAWIIPAAMCGGALFGAFLVVLVQEVGKKVRKEDRHDA